MALDLSGKIFGLPVPVVGGVIGLGLVALLYFRNSSQAAASTAPQTVAVPDVGPGDQVDSRGTQDGGSGAQTAVFTSNGTWTATALGWIVATQGASPLAVQAAIEKYLTGETLTYEQGQLMDEIIGKFGLPPQGVTGMSTITPKSVKLVDPPVEPGGGTVVPRLPYAQWDVPDSEGYRQKPEGTVELTTNGDPLVYTDDGYKVMTKYGYSETSFA